MSASSRRARRKVTHLPAGLAHAATGDVWLNPQHPPLVKLLAGLAAFHPRAAAAARRRGRLPVMA